MATNVRASKFTAMVLQRLFYLAQQVESSRQSGTISLQQAFH